MSSRSKTTKVKSNSQKKLRKSVREPEIQDNQKPLTQCNIGTQTIDNKISSSDRSNKNTKRDSSICKSLENILHVKNVNHDTISMSKTDISIVYGMYKTLVQKNSVNNEIHIENHQIILNELRKFQCQLNEQELCHKSLVNLVTALMARQRMGRGMRTKKSHKASSKANKMMIMKLSQIISVVYKLQCSIESLETKSLTLDSKIDESMGSTNLEKLQKNKKKSTTCCCMQ